MTACGFVWAKVFNLAELRGGGSGGWSGLRCRGEGIESGCGVIGFTANSWSCKSKPHSACH